MSQQAEVQTNEESPARPRGRAVRVLSTIILILAILHAYIGWRLLPALPVSTAGLSIGIALLALSASLIPLGTLSRFFAWRQAVTDRLAWAGFLCMGLFSSMLVLTLARDVLLLAFAASARFSHLSAAAVPLLALLVTLVGFINARRLPRVVDVDIPLRDLPAALAGFTIVQISDLHIGPTIKAAKVEAIVRRVNALGADLIALTGDLVDGSVEELAADIAPLGKLTARHGAYVVTGNHEYYSGAPQWVAEYRRIGLHALMNEHEVLQHGEAALVVAGVTDYTAYQFDPAQRSDPARALAGSPSGIPRILLAHQPRSAQAASDAGFDLQLSGHTHGGQFWPWNLFVRLQQPYTAGLDRLEKLWIYTSRGTGYWGPPKRFGAPAEITRLRLVAAT
ncbi:MAG: metallophosphoesterase [Rhodocyclales bacterium]|nr:metallophosphoesterase [Rhodocyclales bacterium]